MRSVILPPPHPVHPPVYNRGFQPSHQDLSLKPQTSNALLWFCNTCLSPCTTACVKYFANTPNLASSHNLDDISPCFATTLSRILNATGSQRKDEHVTEVIGHSSHVTVYALDVSTKAWVSRVSSVCSHLLPTHTLLCRSKIPQRPPRHPQKCFSEPQQQQAIDCSAPTAQSTNESTKREQLVPGVGIVFLLLEPFRDDS